LKRIASVAGKKTNAAKWFHYYAFDVMGDVASGKSFDLLQTGKIYRHSICWLKE
jgi:tryprostatin B 6-hydroxylase